MAKMCKHWSVVDGVVMCDGHLLPSHLCPKGVSPNTCKVKRKPKMVKVKGYFFFSDFVGGGVCAYTHKSKVKGDMPCTILIDSKYMKGDK